MTALKDGQAFAVISMSMNASPHPVIMGDVVIALEITLVYVNPVGRVVCVMLISMNAFQHHVTMELHARTIREVTRATVHQVGLVLSVL